MEEVQQTICKVAITCGSKVLLLKRSRWVRYHKGRWDLPGGALDREESQSEAAIRECMEEAGILVTEEQLEVVASKVGVRDGHTALRVCFKVELKEETMPDLSFEHSEYAWLDIEEVKSTDLPDFYKESCVAVLS